MLFIISGPTGVGKDSIISQLGKHIKLNRVPSCVTRDPRKGESGYRYFTKDEFMQKINDGEFLEFVKVHGEDYYGTLKTDIQKATNSNKLYIKILDVDGYQKVKVLGIDCTGIFIDPPSKDELKRRIIARGETEQSAKLRLSRVDYEMSKAGIYNYRVKNDNLQDCVNSILTIIASYI